MIIVYGSRYGAAKRYAEKLADMAGAAAIPFEDVSALRSKAQTRSHSSTSAAYTPEASGV